METENQFHGVWWLPDRPDRTIAGFLTVDPQEESPQRLLLFDELFLPLPDEDGVVTSTFPDLSTDHVPLILGVANGQPISVLDSTNYGATTNIAHYHSTVERFGPTAVIVGTHLDSCDEKRFSGVSVEADHLTAWSAMRGITGESNLDDGVLEVVYQARSLDSQSVEVDGHTLRLSMKQSFSARPIENSDERTIAYSERVYAQFSAAELQSWRMALSLPARFRQLLTVSTGEACPLRSRRLLGADGPDCRVFVRAHPKPKAAVESRSTEFLFSLEDVGLAGLYPAWIDICDKAQSGVDILASLMTEKPKGFENSLFNSLIAAESLHRGLVPEESNIQGSEDFLFTLRAKVEGALDEGEWGWAERKLIDSGIGLSARMNQLVAIPSQEAVRELVGDPAKWRKYAVKARNAIAHVHLDSLDRFPDDVKYRLRDITTYLLLLVLMEELGLGADVQKRFVESNRCWYQAMKFKSAI